MLILFILLAIGVAILSAGTAVFVAAIVNAVLAVWSNGVLANYSKAQVDEAPNWASMVSMLTIAGSIGLGIAALVLR